MYPTRPSAATIASPAMARAKGCFQRGIDRSDGGRMSRNCSSEPDSTDFTVSSTGGGDACSTAPSGLRTDTGNSGVSKVPGAKIVTLRCCRVVSVPSPLETLRAGVCDRTSNDPHLAPSLGSTTTCSAEWVTSSVKVTMSPTVSSARSAVKEVRTPEVGASCAKAVPGTPIVKTKAVAHGIQCRNFKVPAPTQCVVRNTQSALRATPCSSRQPPKTVLEEGPDLGDVVSFSRYADAVHPCCGKCLVLILL